MNKILYILGIFLFFSCTSRTIYKKPDNLIDKKTMIDIWTDIYIASSAKSFKTKTLRKDINYIPLVMEKYHIDSVQFSESNLYYTSKIDEYEKMLKEVNKRLEKKKEKYKPPTELDSILKANKERMEKQVNY